MAQGRFQGVKNEPNGPTWTNVEPKGEGGIAKMEPTASKSMFRKGRFQVTSGGHLGTLGVLGPDRLLFRIMLRT